jgi:cobaltochelatase CobS
LSLNYLQLMKTLKPEYLELKEEFESRYGDSGCTCFQNAPCSYCTHPGNPLNLEEDEDAWEEERLDNMNKVSKDIKDIADALSNIGAKVKPAQVKSVLKMKASNSKGEVMEIDPDIVDELEIAVASKAHINLVGPPGCGKTTIRDMILSQINKDFVKVQCHKRLDVEELFGGPIPDGRGGITTQLGAIAECARDGIPLGLEEVDSLSPDNVFPLFPLLGPDKWIDVQLGAETVRVVKHPDFFCIATSNTNGTGDYSGSFAGTEIMNSALADRFSYTINVDYLKSDQELKVLELKTGIDAKTGQDMISIARETRLKAAAQEAVQAISTRRLIAWAQAIMAAKSLNKNLSIMKAAHIAILNRTPEEYREAMKEVIERTFAGR